MAKNHKTMHSLKAAYSHNLLQKSRRVSLLLTVMSMCLASNMNEMLLGVIELMIFSYKTANYNGQCF